MFSQANIHLFSGRMDGGDWMAGVGGRAAESGTEMLNWWKWMSLSCLMSLKPQNLHLLPFIQRPTALQTKRCEPNRWLLSRMKAKTKFQMSWAQRSQTMPHHYIQRHHDSGQHWDDALRTNQAIVSAWTVRSKRNAEAAARGRGGRATWLATSPWKTILVD